MIESYDICRSEFQVSETMPEKSWTHHDLALLISFSVYDQVKHTPAKLRKTTYVVNEEDPVQSTTCAVMWNYY